MKFNKKMEKFLKTRNFESLTKYMIGYIKTSDFLLDIYNQTEEKQDMSSNELYDLLPKYIDMIPHEEFVMLNPNNPNNVTIIKEIDNGIKVTTCLQQGKDFNNVDTLFKVGVAPDMPNQEYANSVLGLFVHIFGFLEILNHKEYRTGKKQIRTFKKQNSTFKMPTYTDVTYISNVKYLNDKSYNTGNGIKWEHSWRVRGHWRRIPNKTLGKDRKGDRSSLGRTWVNPGVRNRGLPDKNNPRILR